MTPQTEYVTLPHFESNVHGLDLTVIVGVETEFKPGYGIAYQEYLFVEIQNLHTSQYYPEVRFSELVLPFVLPGSPTMIGVQEGMLYAAMSSDLHPTKITLEENLQEADHFGANIVIWVDEEKIVEVLVAPLVTLTM